MRIVPEGFADQMRVTTPGPLASRSTTGSPGTGWVKSLFANQSGSPGLAESEARSKLDDSELVYPGRATRDNEDKSPSSSSSAPSLIVSPRGAGQFAAAISGSASAPPRARDAAAGNAVVAALGPVA